MEIEKKDFISKIYIILPGILTNKRSGFYNFYNKDNENVYSIDTQGYEIISSCDGRSVEDIINFLAKKYSSSFNVIYRDVKKVIEEALEIPILSEVLDYYNETSIFYEIMRGNYSLDIEKIEKILKTFNGKRIKVIDIGAGSGRLLRIFKDKFPNVEFWGLENSLSMLLLGYAKNNERLFLGDMEDLSGLPKNYFDLAIFGYHSFDCILSKEGQKKALERVHEILMPKGLVFINSLSNKFQPEENRWDIVADNIKLGNVFLEVWSFFRNLGNDLHECYWNWTVRNERGEVIQSLTSNFKRSNLNEKKLDGLLKKSIFKVIKIEKKGKEIYLEARKV